MAPKLIIALDMDNEKSVLQLLEQIDPKHCAIKVGLELFTALGPRLVKTLIAQQFKIFLDLKFHDIPNTVAGACRAGADLGVWMMNVHASGGLAMMQAAREAIAPFGDSRPLLIAVTVLTSMSEAELPALGIQKKLTDQVCDLARLTQQAGLDGIVCSALEAKMIKGTCGKEFLTITPGIRLNSDAKDDQSRIITPDKAIKEGSDFLVIGRPITRAANPHQVVSTILSMI